jgi:hypothetical protein
MSLLFTDILNGTFSIAFVTISTIVGITIITRYFKEKNITILYMGAAMVLIACPWWSSSISFIIGLITNGTGLPESLYFIIGNVMVPGFQILFTAALAELKFEEHKKKVIWILIVIGILFEIFLFSTAFVPEWRHAHLGVIKSPSIVDNKFHGILQIYLIITIIYIPIVGALIALETMRLLDPEIKLKGKFLLTSFIFFAIGAIMDGMLDLTAPIIAISRTFLIFAAIFFYFGFILPHWVKNLILK